MSTDPKPTQYEFTDEQNRTISGLAGAMTTVASLMKLLGLAFGILCGLQLAGGAKTPGGYGPVLGLGAATLLCLSIGIWTGGAATSFRRVVESQGEDIWHMMNALGRLHSMYSLLRTIVVGTLVLAVVGLAVAGFGLVQKP